MIVPDMQAIENRVHEQFIENGYSEAQWNASETAAKYTLIKCGFASKKDVRLALVNAKCDFIG